MVNGVECTDAQIKLLASLTAAKAKNQRVSVRNYTNSEKETKNIVFAFSTWEAHVEELKKQVKALVEVLPERLASELQMDFEIVARARLDVLDAWQKKIDATLQPGGSGMTTTGPIYFPMSNDGTFWLSPSSQDKVYIRNVLVVSEEIVVARPPKNSRPLTIAKEAIIARFKISNRPDFQLGLSSTQSEITFL